MWWRSGPWFDPGLLAFTYHCLRLGDWSLAHASSFVLLPSAAFPWDVTVGGSCMSPLLKCLYYFLEILDSISSGSLVPSWVTFDSFSSSAPSIFMPGLIRKRGWECWSVSSSTSLHGSWSSTALRLATLSSPSLLRLNLLLIPRVSILSEQMKFCFSQNTFFLILTKE